MASLAKAFAHRYVKPALRRIWPWRHKNLNGMRVHYVHRLDGGGSAFGQEYVPYLRNRGMPRQMRTFEWCAGPGFIGFSLLGGGLTETLCLADINPEAVAACRRTIADNAVGTRVDVYVSDNLASIPHSEQWDLVVGNPRIIPTSASAIFGGTIRSGAFTALSSGGSAPLKPGGVIVLQENSQGSTAETFPEMIAQADLEVLFVEFGPKARTTHGHIYYIGIARRGDDVPSWARGTLCC
jgi:hypothetical protein